MSFLSGYANIFSREDERARQDSEGKQRQRKPLQDAAHLRRQAEQITLPFQAEVFRREADAKIKGLELRLNQDKAKKEGMEFRQFADQTIAKKLGGLFGGGGLGGGGGGSWGEPEPPRLNLPPGEAEKWAAEPI